MVPLEAYVSKYTLDTNTALVSGNTYVEVTQLASVRVELVVVEFGELFFMGLMLVGTQRERGTERECRNNHIRARVLKSTVKCMVSIVYREQYEVW